MQEDEIDVSNDDSLANYRCVDDNATECEPSTSSTLKQQCINNNIPLQMVRLEVSD